MAVKLCFLCGKDGADTTEHVVPRCLYPGPLPSDVITLPAHRKCNESTSKDEEAFRNHVAVAIPPEHPAHALVDRTIRALHRPQAERMRDAFLSRLVQMPALDEDGMAYVRAYAALLDSARGDRIMAKIVKGLFHFRTRRLFPNDDSLLWHVTQLPVDPRRTGEFADAFEVHDVLRVRWVRHRDDQRYSVWVIGFHDVVWFSVSTIPADSPFLDKLIGRPPVPIVWP